MGAWLYNKWVQAGAAATATAAIAGLWMLLELPTLAWSGDIQKLDKRQAETAVEVYGQKVRGLIANAPRPEAGEVTRELWKEELDGARRQLLDAERRKIQISK